MADSKGVVVLNTPNTAPKLTKKNYGEWCMHMRILFRGRGLWKFLQDSDEDKPIPTTDQSLDIADLIYPLLSTEVRLLLASDNFEDGVALWKTIKTALVSTGKREYIKLQRQLRALEYPKSGSRATTFHAAYKKLVDAIEATGVKDSADNRFLLELLDKLPHDEYGTTIQIWHSMDIETLTSDKALQMLIEEEKRQEQDRHRAPDSDQAYILKTAPENSDSTKDKDKDKKKTSKKTCSRCKGKGHVEKHCWHSHPELRPA